MEAQVCIVGAGPAGASAALFLAKQGIPSVLIDKSSFPRDKICGDACSGKVAWVLRKLDEEKTDSVIANKENLPSWGIKFFGSKNNELKVPFKINYNVSSDVSPGFIAKRIDFDNQLIDWVRESKLIELIEDCPIQYYRRVGNCIELGNESKSRHFKASVLLAGDGAYSKAAKDLMQIGAVDDKNSLGVRAYYCPDIFGYSHYLMGRQMLV